MNLDLFFLSILAEYGAVGGPALCDDPRPTINTEEFVILPAIRKKVCTAIQSTSIKIATTLWTQKPLDL